MNNKKTSTSRVLTAWVLTLAMVLALIPSFPLTASANIASGTDWTLDNDGLLTISSNAGMANWILSRSTYALSVTQAVIQSGVTGINAGTLMGCANLTTITIPDSVTSIGNYAFQGCTSLEAITIPDDVTSIGMSAFYNCTKLEAITIPDNVTAIGQDAFAFCMSLTSVTFTRTTPPSFGENIFRICDALTEITVPCTTVPAYTSALAGNLSGETVVRAEHIACDTDWTLDNDGVMTLSYNGAMPDFAYAFEQPWAANRNDIKSIVIGGGVTRIGNRAFVNCENVTGTLTIPANVETVGVSAFSGTAITELVISSYSTTLESTSINNNSKLKSIVFPDCSITLAANPALGGNPSFAELDIAGNTVVIRAEPYDGRAFLNWSANPGIANTALPDTTYNITRNSGAATLTANYAAMANIRIDENPQIYTFDGNPQAFIIKNDPTDTNPAPLPSSGFSILYNGAPTPPTLAGIYDLLITRSADGNYNAYYYYSLSGLVINPMPISGTPVINIDGGGAIKGGSVLSVSGVTPAGATLSYLWKANGTQAGTSATYQVKDSDTGKTITVEVSGIGNYEGTLPASAPTGVVAQCSHSFTVYANNTATCTAAGTETAACDDGCGATDSKPATALGHSPKATDCTACNNCADSLGTHAPKTTDCTACNDCSATLGSHATHTEYNGNCTTAVLCGNNGACTHVELAAQSGHAGTAGNDCTIAAICTRNGCNQEAIAASGGHDWDSGTPESGKVCGETADTIHNCTVTACTQTNTVAGSLITHSYSAWTSGNNATCTADGTESRTCTRTGCPDSDGEKIQTQTETGSALGHAKKPANCTECDRCGLSGVTGVNAAHTFTADRQSQGTSGHDFKCTDCTARGGLTAHTANVCACGYGYPATENPPSGIPQPSPPVFPVWDEPDQYGRSLAAVRNWSIVISNVADLSAARDSAFDYWFKTGRNVHIPADVISLLKDANATLMMNTGMGVTFGLSGGNVPIGFDAGSINLTVKNGGLHTPATAVNALLANTLANRMIAMESRTGLGMVISMHYQFGPQNTGNYANLYRYDEETKEFIYLGSYLINEKGQAMFGITGGADYLVTVTADHPGILALTQDDSYLVLRGDTISRIAARNGISVNRLLALNPEIANIHLIRPGQRLKLR